MDSLWVLGHSLGGVVTSLFAENWTDDLPISVHSIAAPLTGMKEFKDNRCRVTEKETYIELLNLLNNGTPIDQLTQVILYRGMTEGIYNVDLMLLLIEPTMYLLIAIAEENEIEPVIYEEQDDDLAETETVQKQIRNKKQSEIRKDSVPSSILQRVKTLPKLDELQTEEEVG